MGCRITEDELQNLIALVAYDYYQLRLTKQDTVSSFVRFCINNFWIGHYNNKQCLRSENRR